MAAETPDLVTVTITGPTVDELALIVRQLVTDGLAACGNIVPGIRSIYLWEGQIQDDAEALALVHTAADRVPELIEAVNAAHSYDTVQILAVPVAAADPDYAEWVHSETRPTAGE